MNKTVPTIAAKLKRTVKKEGLNRSKMMLLSDFKFVSSTFLPSCIATLSEVSDDATD